MPTPGTNVTSVERALLILETLDGARRGLNISEVGRRLKVPKSTAHIIMLTLERAGYIVRDPETRNYVLAMKAYVLGREAVRSMVLPKAALPQMRVLADKLNLTVHLAVLEKNQAVYVQKVDGPGPVRFDTFIGKRTNLHCTAVGKVLLGHSPESVQRAFLAKGAFARYTRKTIFSSAVLKGALDEVRAKGYAFDNQEEELDVCCLAVPVFRYDNEAMAALSITGTIEQIEVKRVEELVRLLQSAAHQIAQSAASAAAV